MKVAGSPKQERVSKIKESSASEKMTEPRNMILGQIKLEDLEQERSEVRKTVEKKTTPKKTTEKKSVSAAKTETKATEVTTEETKNEVTTEAAETPVEETAVETKTEEPAAKKAETKTTRTRTTAAKKDEKETKTTAKKDEKETKTKSTAKAPTVEKVVLQMSGRDLAMSNLIDRVKSAYVAEGHKADAIKNIEVYIKIEENMAYYVIDEYASGIRLFE